MKQESNLPSLNEFIRSHDEEWELSYPKDPKKREHQNLIVGARRGLEDLVGNLLSVIDGDSIEYKELCDFVLNYLKRLEKYHYHLHVKTMPNGTTRIFKEIHCRRGSDIWRKCPEYQCPGLSADETWECPHKSLKYVWEEEVQQHTRKI